MVDEDALDALPEQLARLGPRLLALVDAAEAGTKALAACAAVWALTEEDVADEVHRVLYEPDDDAWGPTEDPTTLDAAHAVLNTVQRTITQHIDPNTFTRKD